MLHLIILPEPFRGIFLMELPQLILNTMCTEDTGSFFFFVFGVAMQPQNDSAHVKSSHLLLSNILDVQHIVDEIYFISDPLFTGSLYVCTEAYFSDKLIQGIIQVPAVRVSCRGPMQRFSPQNHISTRDETKMSYALKSHIRDQLSTRRVHSTRL